MTRVLAAAMLMLTSVLGFLGVIGASSSEDQRSGTRLESPAAATFSGPDDLVDDPTTDGRITARMLHTLLEAQAAFDGWPWGVSCWDRHAWNPTSDHPQGRACDFTVGRIGRLPRAADRAAGWRLATWAKLNSGRLGIAYVIWDGRIWSGRRSREGWRPYGGGGVYDPNSITGGHHDHVHISVVP